MAGLYNAKTQFRTNIAPYLKEIKARITEVANQANSVTGAYRGSFSTVAAMPTASPVKNGDWAILNTDDGANESGIYVKGSSGWQFVQDITNFAEIVQEVIASAAEWTAGTSTTKAPSVAQAKSAINQVQTNLTSAVSTINANFGNYALKNGDDRNKFAVADADAGTMEAVNAKQLEFSITDAEATLDYTNA